MAEIIEYNRTGFWRIGTERLRDAAQNQFIKLKEESRESDKKPRLACHMPLTSMFDGAETRDDLTLEQRQALPENYDFGENAYVFDDLTDEERASIDPILEEVSKKNFLGIFYDPDDTIVVEAGSPMSAMCRKRVDAVDLTQ